MILLTRKLAQFLGITVFFLLLMVGIFSMETFDISKLPAISIKAFAGFLIFWILGLIISDIILKGIKSSVEETLLNKHQEGGILSQFLPNEKEEHAELFERVRLGLKEDEGEIKPLEPLKRRQEERTGDK